MATHPGIISEIARERETFKYDPLTLSTAGLRGPHPPKPIPSSLLSTAPDPGLTAFAQLGLYRLNASRAMISLFDRKYQHIVAEALRTAATPPLTRPFGEPEHNWFNGLALERATSVCEHVVTGSAVTQSIPGTTSGLTPADMPVSVIDHLDKDARFCHIQDPGRQFYAGVPIRSPKGINIGVYCVFDDKPRPQGLSSEEVQFIRDISRVVMDYLESKMSHEWYRREQRMIRGLGNFAKGHATLRTNTEDESDQPASFQDLPGMKEGMLNKKLPPADVATGQQEEGEGISMEAPAADSQLPSWSGRDRELDPVAARADSTEIPVTGTAQPPKSAPARQQSGDTDLLRGNIKRVFSKAANVIRESIEVEGVLFLDAAVRSYGGLVGNISTELPSLLKAPSSPSGQSSSDESERGYNKSKKNNRITGHTVCDVLGFSTSQSSSIVKDGAPNELTRCKEQFLQRLLQRYPRGHVWNFEADGTILDHYNLDGDDSPNHDQETPISHSLSDIDYSHNETLPSSAKRRLATAARIIKMFPGARSIAVVPLWDAQTGRWYAGGFAWTRTPTRTFSEENEMTYLRVFGLSIMAEVARLKSQTADKAKNDILGSISHELRSPLHGLVGSVDLLRQTALDPLQDSVLRSIEASGRTLLDTIEHLLDFVKINGKVLLRAQRSTRSMDIQHRSSLSAQDLLPLPEPTIQLDLLMEEVVESVLAGSGYLTKSELYHATSFTSRRNSFATNHSTPITNNQSDSQCSCPRAAVQVYLDIDHSARWSFRMHPGAFRRIIMNLFGNSLKFTRTGFIRVSLRQASQETRSDETGTTLVVLSVSDSGKGMSEEYLRHNLFTPFSQEDQFSLGTGLGLSLVRQMTATMGGNIDVSSELGRGTTVTVTLPLSRVVVDATDGEESTFWQSMKTLTGKRVQLCGFESEPKTVESHNNNHDETKSQYRLLEEVCRDMLQMTVIPEHNSDSVIPDFVICNADDAVVRSHAEAMKLASKCPFILTHQDQPCAHRLANVVLADMRSVFEVCFQPIGPRKLARALLACQQRWRATQTTSIASKVVSKDLSRNMRMQQDNERCRMEVGQKDIRSQQAQEGRNFTPPEPGLSILANSQTYVNPLSIPLLKGAKEDVSSEEVKIGDSKFIAVEPRGPILVVDDNAINLKIMAAYLTKLKHPYTTAINGLEALNIFTSAPSKHRCILTDISMPVMDGIESTRRVREFELAHGHKPVFVIALTGLSGAEIREDAIASGVDMFLTRPLTLRGLEEALTTTGLRAEKP